MGRYREERKLAVRRKKNMMHLQMIQLEGLAVHFEHNLSTTGPRTVMPELKISSNGGIRGYTAQYRPSGAHSRVYQ